jgi:putative membrane protein
MKRFGLVLLLTPAPAFGHAPALAHENIGNSLWTFDPWITVPLLLSAALYATGALRLRRRGVTGRRKRFWRGLAYTAGWCSLAAALVSPLHWFGEQLFTAHMIEHEVVMTIAAPLLVLARPGGVLLWAFRTNTRREVGRLARGSSARRCWEVLTRPLTATVLHGVAIWAWHVPLLFDAAVADIVVHRLQHLTFFTTAILFWWAMLWRSHPAVAAGEIFITMIHTGILGALMTFAPHVLYGTQSINAEYWGFTPLEDQQLAGLVMWIPVGTIYAGAAIGLLGRWVKRSGKSWKVADALAP